jgi:DNA-binding NtrC family response regulator
MAEWPSAVRTNLRLVPPVNAAVPPSRQHVLLVEDHAEVRAMLARALRHAGFESLQARTCTEARGLLARNPVDAAVIDILLAGAAEGTALAGWIRDRRPMLPLVFTTGPAGLHHPFWPLADARARVVYKPFGARAVVDFVTDLLSPAVPA